MKFLRFLLLAFILTSVAIWLINAGYVQLILPSKLNREIDRCQNEQDLAVSIRMLQEVLAKYPEAPNLPVAEQLLKTRQRQLTHTEQLIRILDQVKNTPQITNALILLKNGMDTYFDATNQANARRILMDLQLRLVETERLAIAIQYAKQSEDATYGVEVLTQTLAESPNAINRQEAEELLAKKKRQQAVDEGRANP
ncbi:MAG: hypothetical protein PHW60_07905 [Kiritimatiellae bacterium]|nr:hypothetical protein [Kiritimatiellia bacterium]